MREYRMANRELFGGAAKSIGGFLMKAKLLIGVVVAAFALSATADMASAATKHMHKVVKAPPPATFDSGPPASLKCKKGQVPVLHSMNPMKMSWGCMKSS